MSAGLLPWVAALDHWTRGRRILIVAVYVVVVASLRIPLSLFFWWVHFEIRWKY